MKKAIAIIILGLLLSGNAYADSVEFKNCKFPHKAMDGGFNLDFKINMEDKSINWGPGFKYFNLRHTKSSNSEFYYEMRYMSLLYANSFLFQFATNLRIEQSCSCFLIYEKS